MSGTVIASLLAAGAKPSPKAAYAASVEAMSDADLALECRHVALLAAFASEDVGSAFHWQKAICAAQADLRGRRDIFEGAMEDAAAA